MNTYVREELLKDYTGLIFNEGPHTYHVKDKPLSSVSNIIETFHEKFDEQKHSLRVANKRGVTQEAILAEWREINERSIKLGNDVHNFGEAYAEWKYYNGPAVVCRADELQKRATINFYNDMPSHYIPVVLELQMFDEELGIAGTADIILLNMKTKKLVIADWKTNADIYKNFGDRTMLPPFQYTLDMPYNHYQIQLSLYQILLESKGYEVEERWIVWLPHTGGYERHKTFDFTDIIKKHLAA